MATLVSSVPIDLRDAENYSSWSSSYQYYGQSFTATGGRLYSAAFVMKKVGTLSGNITAQLWSHSGTFGTSSVGSELLATSDALVADSTITTSHAIVEFFFTGNDRYQMVDGTQYVITFYWPGVGSDVDNRILVGTDSTTPAHEGNMARRTEAGAWDAEAVDTCFYVYKLSGTVGAPTQDNMNAIAGTTGLSIQGAANSLAGTTNLSIQDALATAYSETGSTQDIINQEVNDGTYYSIQDGLGKL